MRTRLVRRHGRIIVGRGNRGSYAVPAQNTTLAGNRGALAIERADSRHTGTKVLPAFDGDAGSPVRMTRAQVGPDAPDPFGTTTRSGEWREPFDHGMTHWWAEGGERVWIEGGRLQVRADAPDKPGGGVATIWCRKPLPADFESRRSAAYNLYHQLNGYIATFVKEAGAARIRLRRNPGFNLLTEHRGGESHAGVTYRLTLRKQAGEITFSIDGREMARAVDPQPWQGGLLGLRTFRTNLWWDNVRVVPPEGSPAR